MLNTRKKRLASDSTAKTPIKSSHLSTKTKTLTDNANAFSTPTRRSRSKNANIAVNTLNDESPILSQEPVSVTWKWGESTPNRSFATKLKKPTAKKSSPQHFTNLYRASIKRKSEENESNGVVVVVGTSKSSSCLYTESGTQSPKGIFKFQEEFRKIDFDAESETSCDNVNDSIMEAPTTPDTGYPNRPNHTQTSLNKPPVEVNDIGPINDINTKQSQLVPHHIAQSELSDSLKNYLLNDSDFDQVLLTCTEKAEECVRENHDKKFNAKKPDVIEPKAGPSSDLSLFNDESIDDILSNIDDSFIINSSKFVRHKSMPQEQQPLAKMLYNPPQNLVQQQTNPDRLHMNRSLTRHESMPLTNVNVLSQRSRQNTASASTSTSTSNTIYKCTSEEIAEKRRLARERLISRNAKRK